MRICVSASLLLFSLCWPPADAVAAHPASAGDSGGLNATALLNQGGAVVINEFMASNSDSIADSHGDRDDWIELYNRSQDPVDVGGLFLTDDMADPMKWQIPADDPSSTTISPKGYLLVWADDEPQQGTLHATFKLNAGGEFVGLCDATGDVIDGITFGSQTENVSSGRLPDGSDSWQSFEVATPGASNSGVYPIVISEIMYHPYHRPNEPEDTTLEWIELFNGGTAPAGLSGWQFCDGVDYLFPDVVVQPGEYLVVAADANAFRVEHPGVRNVVGGWTKRLANTGETIELVDAAGRRIDRVEYAEDGDWAIRELGPIDHDHRGWRWRNDHDGGGKSLELINPDLPNEYGQSWAASAVDGGTPGYENSVYAADTAPLILDVAHAPAVPTSAEAVTVTARVVGELLNHLEVALCYRRDGEPNFSETPMLDDDMLGSRGTGGRAFGAQLPPLADGDVVEFYVRVTNAPGFSRTWPAPSQVDGQPQQVTNALYLVDDAFDSGSPVAPGGKPLYYLVMTKREQDELEAISDRNYEGNFFASEAMSNAQMNATFISVDGSGTKVRYRVGVRNRGNRKRANPPMSYHVNFTGDRPWKDIRALNLNSKYPHCELMGSVLFQKAGLAAADVTVVRLNVNGDEPALRDYGRTYGFFSAVEVLNSDWAERHFPGDDNGNLYRCTYYTDGTFNRILANLDRREEPGETPDPNDYYFNYPKKTNQAAYDWSDLFALIDVLNDRSIPDSNFVGAVGEVLDLRQWLRFLAVDALIGNREGGLATGIGDDYALYRGVNDPRFHLVPHDMDTLLGQGDPSGQPGRDIFVYAGVTGLRRLLNHPDVVRLYYEQFRELAETVFAPENVEPLIDQFLAGWVPSARIDGPQGIKQFLRDRADSVLYSGYPNPGSEPQIPQVFSISSPDLDAVIHLTRLNTLSLTGRVNAIESGSVRVNGVLVNSSDLSQRDGTWSMGAIPLDPGINRIIVEAFDDRNGAGRQVDRGHFDIWYDDGDTKDISGTLLDAHLLDAESGPWWVTGDIIIPAGVTLTVEPGVTMFFEAGAGIVVETGGRLAVTGEPYRRIRLGQLPGTAMHWDGIRFDHTLEDNRLSYVDMEFGDAQGASIDVQHARVSIEDATWAGTNTCILNLDHPTVTVRNCVFPSIDGSSLVHGVGLAGQERLVFERCTFGTAAGYNAVIDFAGAKRPGPILEIYDCVFLGGGDDGIDLDGTDAHIEGCLFAGFKDGQGDDGAANAIAAGQTSGHPADIWVARNLFVGNDNAILLKEDCFLTAENNSFIDTGAAVISFGEPDRNPPRPAGRGAYMAGSIFWDNATLFQHFFEAPRVDYGPAEVTIDYSILPEQWHSLGLGNIDADPLFVGPDDFRLKSMSPARGMGLWDLDAGAHVPAGAVVSGEPPAVTHRTDAVLTAGGPGITHYRYSLNDPGGPWSQETPTATPIELFGLEHGRAYTAYVLGKNSAGVWQEQPNASRTWTVDAAHRWLVINEVLAINETAYEHEGTFPDFVELFYDGPAPLDLSGMMLSDDVGEPDRFVFTSRMTATPGDYLVLFADANDSTPGIHLGFGLNSAGDELFLFDRDGTLLDSVTFGHQLSDRAIGRVGRDGHWVLTTPTPGQANVAQPLGDPDQVRISEWLAAGQVLFESDFIELHNAHSSPVDIGGFYLTDNSVTQRDKFSLRPLTFIAGQGSSAFEADGEILAGHVDFRLSQDRGLIGLFGPDLREVDTVIYGPQTPDVSQGRSPNGADRFEYFVLPTPGLSNPGLPDAAITTVNLVPEGAAKRAIVPVSAEHVGEEWRSALDFDDSAWLIVSRAPGGIGYDRGSGYSRLISLDVEEQMYGRQTTCYVRIPFHVEAAQANALSELFLNVRYDDGFVAYLNGVEVARANLAGTPAWDSRAEGGHEAHSQAFDLTLDLSPYRDALRAGDHLLALQGLNASPTSSDFIISVALEGTIIEIQDGQEYPYLEQLKLLDNLRVTELMYHAPQGDDLDYVELQNTGDELLDLTGLRFVDGVDFVFPSMTLGPGEYAVVVADLSAFRSQYGTNVTIAGAYEGRFSDRGEDIVLKLARPQEAAIMRFSYSDDWHPATDGGGQSLAIDDPAAAPVRWNDPDNWRAYQPTPGAP